MDRIHTFSKEQFKGFLLAYSSHVDFNFSEAEKDLIRKCLPDTTEAFLKTYEGYSEQERITLIVEGVIEHLKTEADVQEFEQALQTQFIADGKYCRFEKCFFKYFSDLVKTNLE